MKVDSKEIEKVIKLLDKYKEVEHIEMETQEGRISVSRPVGTVLAQAPVVAAAAPVMASETAEEPRKTVGDVLQNSKMKAVKAPLVGTFYRAPSPDSDPYVKEGQRVKKGEVLCIVEAMKLMNEIESEYSGIVHSILAENSQPVEFGEPLFIIEVQ